MPVSRDRRPCPAPRRPAPRPAARAPRARARADRCARECRAAAAARSSIGDDRRQQPIHALRQRLHDEVVAVAIDDQRRQQVGFAVDQPVRGRVDRRATRGTRSPPRSAAAAARRRPIAARRSVSMRSAICDRSLYSAEPSVLAARAAHLHDVAGRGARRRRRRRDRSTDGRRAAALRRARR